MNLGQLLQLPAWVLDKDGTVIHPASGVKFVNEPTDQALMPGVGPLLQRYGGQVILASNQGGCAFYQRNAEGLRPGNAINVDQTLELMGGEFCFQTNKSGHLAKATMTDQRLNNFVVTEAIAHSDGDVTISGYHDPITGDPLEATYILDGKAPVLASFKTIRSAIAEMQYAISLLPAPHNTSTIGLFCPDLVGAERWEVTAESVSRMQLEPGLYRTGINGEELTEEIPAIYNNRKPGAGMLLRACELMKAKPDALLYVGDMHTDEKPSDRQAAAFAKMPFMEAGIWRAYGMAPAIG